MRLLILHHELYICPTLIYYVLIRSPFYTTAHIGFFS